MRAVIFERFGGPEVLREVELERPVPGPRQVLVRVKASSVNPVDIQTRRGEYAALTPAPGRLGVDVSGVVEAVGGSVHEFRPGDEVFYVPRLLRNEGGYSEFHVEDADIVALKPASLSFEEAAALPLAAGTAWECLIERARIEPGERVLVHGASGGVGVYATQIAHATGAFVAGTCRAENADFVKRLGADIVLDYRDGELSKRLLDATNGRGFDVVLDTVGGKMIENGLPLLAEFGRLVSIVDQPLPQNLAHGWEKNASLHFVLTTQKRARLQRLADMAERGLLAPVIELTLPLAEARTAHEMVEAGSRRGKIILRV